MTTSLSKLRWSCRRGMRELDVILEKYLDEHFIESSADKQQAFKELLTLEDPLLFSLLMGNQQSPNQAQQDIINDLHKLFTP